jgi:hypothetical protein
MAHLLRTAARNPLVGVSRRVVLRTFATEVSIMYLWEMRPVLRRAVASLRRSRSEQKLEKTAFHDLHMSLKGKVSLRPALRLNLSDEQNSVVVPPDGPLRRI